jgi:hypothetical protein
MRITFFFIGFLLFCKTGTAQVAVTNTGTAYIVSGTDVYINGDLTNSSAAALTNNGQLYIRQNITNDQASMAAGTGTLYLNGSIAQTLGGSQPFKTFNLVTNNAAGITLNANLSVSGAHTFTNGLVTTSATPNYLIYESGSSYSGSNDSRHVNGWVKKIGNTNFTFPVGDATYERAVAISNLSAASEFNCKYNTPTSNPNNLTGPLVQVKGNEYWQIDQVSGGNAQVTLNWDHSKVAMDNILIADILAGHYSGGSWISRGGVASGNVTTTGTITSNLIGTFGPFTLGYKTYPIPLKLLSFTAERRSGSNHLKWITENEYNVDRFEVQRSYDGVIYSAIGNVAARNTSSLQNYLFEDRSSFTGLAYYRIKSIDIDGTFSFSNIVVLSENDLHTGDIIVLSPARNNITILNRTGKQGLFTYRLFNAGGQLISSGHVTMGINGGAALALPSIMSSGTCILEISQGPDRFIKKILIQ